MKLWRVALAAFLFLWGLLSLSNFQFQLSGFVLGVLAIAAGVLLAIDK